MTPADLARRLYLDQCRHNDLSSYGERAAVAAMVPLIEALERAIYLIEDAEKDTNWCSAPWHEDSATVSLRAALTPQPEEVA